MTEVAQSPAAANLPRIDDHSIVVTASVDTTWKALLGLVASMRRGRLRRVGVAILGAQPSGADDTPLDVRGAAVPGFEVSAVDPPRCIELRGWHHWSAYCLRFRVEPVRDGATRLTAETEAMFPGRAGGVYRRLVIGTRFHVRAVSGLLNGVRRRAEGARP